MLYPEGRDGITLRSIRNIPFCCDWAEIKLLRLQTQMWTTYELMQTTTIWSWWQTNERKGAWTMTARSIVIRSSGLAGNTPLNWWDWFCLRLRTHIYECIVVHVQMFMHTFVCACTELLRIYFSWHEYYTNTFIHWSEKRACSRALLPNAVAILPSCRVKIWGREYESTVLQIYTKEACQKLFCKTPYAFLFLFNSLDSFKC